jgi:hypothetical protein
MPQRPLASTRRGVRIQPETLGGTHRGCRAGMGRAFPARLRPPPPSPPLRPGNNERLPLDADRFTVHRERPCSSWSRRRRVKDCCFSGRLEAHRPLLRPAEDGRSLPSSSGSAPSLGTGAGPRRWESYPAGRPIAASVAQSAPCFSPRRWHRLTQEQAEVLAIVISGGIATRRRIEEVRGGATIDRGSGQLWVRRGKGSKPRPVSLLASVLPSLQDWLQMRGDERGALYCAALKNGRLVRDSRGQLQPLSGSAVCGICKERAQGGIQPHPHDPRRVILVGHMASAPELRSTPSGSAVAQPRLATNEGEEPQQGTVPTVHRPL